MDSLSQLCRRAEELDLEEEAAEYLEAFLEAAEEAIGAFEGNREEAPDIVVGALVPLPEVLWALGELKRIEYDRLEDGEPIRRFHDFKGERPILAVDPDSSDLWIVGGTYTVTDRGIEG